jgi:hypothetical protein
MLDPKELRSIAEEHGDCCREFMEVGCQPDLCYHQAAIAAHFARLWMEREELTQW